ncbi:MAG: ribosome maturation factor RimP [Gammaproteobacteria bacterium]|nr:ribosome maturation factor RimP [Gammaproteobacteria bacterium]
MLNQDQISEILTPVIEAMGYELEGVETYGSGLRIYIDRADGVSIDDCSRVSRQVDAVLKVEGLDTSHYSIEVSSPGINRRLFTLEQFKRFKGEIAEVRLKDKIEGNRHFKGNILDVTPDGTIKIQVLDKEVAFPFHLVERANLIRI